MKIRPFTFNISTVCYVFVILLFSSLYACSLSPNFSTTPELTFIDFNKQTMRQGTLNQDSVSLILDFKDGDGDIGTPSNEQNLNLFLIDSRTNQIYDSYKIPAIPEKGANNGIEGRITLNVFSTCCRFSNAPPCSKLDDTPTNKLTLSVYMLDRAGNKSNTVNTSELTLLCN
jgi:hypothetical protein